MYFDKDNIIKPRFKEQAKTDQVSNISVDYKTYHQDSPPYISLPLGGTSFFDSHESYLRWENTFVISLVVNFTW